MQANIKEYCELCGSPINGKGITVSYEGSIITVCNSCYNKIKKNASIVNENKKKQETGKKIMKHQPKMENMELEIVADYYKIIKSAREKLGLSQQELAQKLKVSENIIKRFESGKLKPTLAQAKQLEKILNVKLIVPVEAEENSSELDDLELTLGDVVNIREGRK
ncbi:MAG: multiprotein bridging factor aMBF1 [Saccharolobus sp.]|jgi:putative transcription factor|uniref:multiprotein bridging factor aMBF1 n=1 Tax=Saccharolobus sp. TaxID=2100761 RepID=UPI0028CFD550|nr:multiprotein bridging factor aMBF1 [Saccharolobus sp.]MDT7862017.1 multiprotein bridging factor aMBF1 [Saccharolobus sp.]